MDMRFVRVQGYGEKRCREYVEGPGIGEKRCRDMGKGSRDMGQDGPEQR